MRFRRNQNRFTNLKTMSLVASRPSSLLGAEAGFVPPKSGLVHGPDLGDRLPWSANTLAMCTGTSDDSSVSALDGEVPILRYREIVVRSSAVKLVQNLHLKFGLPREVHAGAVEPVIESFAEFVQLLPDLTSSSHCGAGGILRHALERVSVALDYRRGQILPPNAAPESLGEQAHRWTYAVFIAALLHGIDQSFAGLQITLHEADGSIAEWSAPSGSLISLGAVRYRVEPERSIEPPVPVELSSLLFNRCVPQFIQKWLLVDACLAREISAFLSTEKSADASVIGALIRRADTVTRGRTSAPVEIKLDMAVSSASQASNDTRTESADTTAAGVVCDRETDHMQHAPPLASSFMRWLCQGLSEGRIPVNRTDAWVHFVGEGMLLVSPRIFREYRKTLASDGSGDAALISSPEKEALKTIQREVLRAGWHVRAPQGVNMLTYGFLRDGRVVSRISGVVIAQPERFLARLPSVNSSLVHLSQGTAEAHGLSA